ncbi:glycosyltransferase [Shouchella lehensis]|uniref:Glycosyltransferase n=1 Tax=Shouchella lehensis G1 TaxID=1246626 RepID=A0A060LUZ0_9BACI|nr:glycosyltransferase [Shouchella lehensis]AIC95076.1 glycosyltransferase [Shouchella lehensis G1]RQW20899.1 glycosyltransferase [Bacillus sp. C1-1]
MYTLLVHHNGGGGVSQYIQTRLNGKTIECFTTARQFWLVWNNRKKEIYSSIYALMNRLKKLTIKKIELHHLWGFSLGDMKLLLRTLDCPYTVYLHDFFGVCPNVFFINHKQRYCEMEKDSSVCEGCVTETANRPILIKAGGASFTVDKWRNFYYTLYKEAAAIVAPSVSTKEMYLAYFPDIHITVTPHSLSHLKQSVIRKHNQQNHKELRLGFLGNVFLHKGEVVVAQLLDHLEQAPLPLALYSYGDLALTLKQRRKIVERGPYNGDNLEEMLRKDQIDVICIPSVVPETFSFTTHEAMTLGYPVLTFNLGAQAEAVKTMGRGWLVDEISGVALYDQLKKQCLSKEELNSYEE